jgi:hypothetical protein
MKEVWPGDAQLRRLEQLLVGGGPDATEADQEDERDDEGDQDPDDDGDEPGLASRAVQVSLLQVRKTCSVQFLS